MTDIESKYLNDFIAESVLGWKRVEGTPYLSPHVDGWGKALPDTILTPTVGEDEWEGSQGFCNNANLGRLRVSRTYQCGSAYFEPSTNIHQAMIVRDFLIHRDTDPEEVCKEILFLSKKVMG